MIQLLLYSIISTSIYMFCWFVVAIIKRDNSIADIAWGLGFVLVALVGLIFGPGISQRQLIITILISVWAFRLTGHILARNKGRGEDFRYANMRRDWGNKVIFKTFTNVFMLQGVFMLIIAYPIILVNSTFQNGLNFLDLLGVIIWVIGFFFESVGDYQLTMFKKNPANKGKIMTTGLWKFTRHPNYFGETTMWWGIFLIAASAPNGLTTIVSPVLITFLLIKVSGIPMLEKKYQNHPDFIEYARKTSSFFPLFPHRIK